MQFAGAGEIKKGFIDGDRLHSWGNGQHHLAHLFADGGIFRHVRPDYHGIWREFQRLEHGHGGAHTANAGDVATCGDHASRTTADDERHVSKARVVALFDGGIKGVAIDVGDGELVQFWMADEAGGTAAVAALFIGLRVGKAIAAEA